MDASKTPPYQNSLPFPQNVALPLATYMIITTHHGDGKERTANEAHLCQGLSEVKKAT